MEIAFNAVSLVFYLSALEVTGTCLPSELARLNDLVREPPMWVEWFWLVMTLTAAATVGLAFAYQPILCAVIISWAVCITWGVADYRRSRGAGLVSRYLSYGKELIDDALAPVALVIAIAQLMRGPAVWLNSIRRDLFSRHSGRHQH